MALEITTNSNDVPEIWVVERLDIDGEELPVLRHAITWMLAPLALRYALRTRFHIGPSTLFSEMRGVCILYNWAEAADGIGNMEVFLTSGRTLGKSDLLHLVTQLRRQHDAGSASPSRRRARKGIVSSRVFNRRLFAVGQFLQWGMDPGHNGGQEILDDTVLEAEISKTVRVLEKQTLSVSESPRHQPLTPLEIELIRRAIAPDEFGQFPAGVFTERTRYRNWVMFETPLASGTRKSEMLTLKQIHLRTEAEHPRLLIPRQQDEAADPRKRRRPRCKTNEREVELSDKAILHAILRYRDTPPPIGRNDFKLKSPYLYVGKDGQPISNSTADYIIKKIGEYAARLAEADESLDLLTRQRLAESLRRLGWHRLRHTWAENAALALYKEYGEGAKAILKEWGGWRSSESVEHYIQNARRKIASEATVNHMASFKETRLPNVRPSSAHAV